MIRPVATGLCLLLAAPAIAETEAERRERCAAQAEIVEQAVSRRASGAEKPAVAAALTEGEAAVPERYTPSVQPLVDWVFELDPAQLTEAVAPVFEKTCRTVDP